MNRNTHSKRCIVYYTMNFLINGQLKKKKRILSTSYYGSEIDYLMVMTDRSLAKNDMNPVCILLVVPVMGLLCPAYRLTDCHDSLTHLKRAEPKLLVGVEARLLLILYVTTCCVYMRTCHPRNELLYDGVPASVLEFAWFGSNS